MVGCKCWVLCGRTPAQNPTSPPLPRDFPEKARFSLCNSQSTWYNARPRRLWRLCVVYQRTREQSVIELVILIIFDLHFD